MEKRDRIPFGTGFLMMGVAIFFDTIGFILDLLFIGVVLNTIIITPLAWLTFYLWFKIRGVNFSDSAKRLGVMTVAGFFELIPVLNALPAWTLSTGLLVAIVRREDAAYNKTREIQQKNVSLRENPQSA